LTIQNGAARWNRSSHAYMPICAAVLGRGRPMQFSNY
jgi:hypothetical protein